jgi:hypothetical protein
VEVWLPREDWNVDIFWTWGLVALGLGFLFLLGSPRENLVPALTVLLSAVVLFAPLSLLYRRYGGPAAARSVVVVCPGCGAMRIDGSDDDSGVKRYRRGAAVFDSLYHYLLPVFLFFAAVLVGARVTDREFDSVSLALLLVSGFYVVSIRWYRGVFGLRSWW